MPCSQPRLSHRIPQVAIALILASFGQTAGADEIPDRVGSPYFVVRGDSGTDRLPLKETRAKVNIAGVIAHVRVTQVYKNEGSNPLEAVYVFPGSTRSAVFAMTMTIGERTIKAQIQEKDKARRMYEQAKSQGKSASLLEQKRPNVFQMNVANIMPGDNIKVEMDYTELLVPEDGVYEFVYPTVVGPRFSDGGGSQSQGWTQNPYLKAGKAPPYRWGIDVKINAGMPIDALKSPSHTVSPRYSGKDSVSLKSDDEAGGNKDFVLKYRLRGKSIQTGMLTFEGKNENFFLMMMQPPERLNAGFVPPREYIFVVDVSGSMFGFPLNTSKALMRELLSGLRPQDRFNIMLFAGGSRVFNERSVSATRDNISRGLALISRQRGGGSTRILPAMRRALKMPRARNMSTSIIAITDGYVSVERETFDLIRRSLGEANFFAFGIGKSVNRHLIEGMARSGMGEPFVIRNAATAATAAKKFKKYIESPVLTNIGLQFKGFDAYDIEPSTIPDLFAERPIVVFGKYKGKAKGKIVVEGYSGKGRLQSEVDVQEENVDDDNQALRYLWARHRIMQLADVGRYDRSGIKREVTNLGLKYSLMTEYTSFIAIDSQVRNYSGTTKVNQPLPVPEGVASGSRKYAKRRMRRPRRGPSRRYAPPSPTKPMAKSRSGASLGGLGSGSRAPAAAEEADVMATPRAEPAPVTAAPMAGGSAGGSTGSIWVRGGLSKSAVAQTIRRYRSGLSKCGASGGRVELVIDSQGRVKSVLILRSTGSSSADRCVAAQMKRWRFRRPSGGEATVRFGM